MIYNGQLIDTPQYVVKLARKLRQNLTIPEKLLWEKLRNKQLRGFRFRCQHPVYRYVLDFYCHEVMLAIEIDGDVHKEHKEYDEYRDELLQNIGIRTLRFKNEEIISNIEVVINTISSILESK
jgi:very-short-patch-repair endonuclease